MLWRCRHHCFDFSDGRTRIMGVLNVTPDSFSDGGRFLDPRAAVARAVEMADAGAEIIDVGGESSRPGATPVPVEEELRRVMPVLQECARELGARVALSIDTTKAEVARQALDGGAVIVNDISAGRFEPALLSAAARAGAGLVLMHMQGTPQTMQLAPAYADVVGEVTAFLRERMTAARGAGIGEEQIVVDPGIGFGKTLGHNLELLARLNEFAALGRPVLVGTSRKGFIGRLLGKEVDERLAGTLATVAWCAARGANIVRVHDVQETAQVLRVIDELRRKTKT
ncbi:MAG: dihydropteroate synthase [Verrucomicrobia bacterium]|nr:dihydropteroate synthase [Verrucomicrobiota bacterium]